ncbi:uncharacterized protein LOC143236417 [Tachypleus tridentatus]|uniref:uncharacterized protein LOC143236417 n=1 Tax=Tachypleus tridentatus TaxID=6853 RepID=UPI003FD64DC9
MNSLVGVFCRFRKEIIAFTCDIEKMFFQFRVQEEDRDFLRILWIEDLSGNVVDYRMKVYLFGSVSSLACAISGVRQLAYDNFQAAFFIQEGFYFDDGLKNVKTVREAIHLIKETQTICVKENIYLPKFLSNKQEVVDSSSLTDRAPKLENLHLPEERTPLERVLGI